MDDSAVPSRALSDLTALARDLSSETANFMGYDSPLVSSHPTLRLTRWGGELIFSQLAITSRCQAGC
ncbi:MAG: hypothetical protein KKH04_21390 [Proteobacteria bacterium]|nr:hypothetical protein [Pseudomonadota bacterium]